jgi:hypothetical protein
MAYFNESNGNTALGGCGSKCSCDSCSAQRPGIAEYYFDDKDRPREALRGFGEASTKVRSIEFPPMTITVPRQKRESILRKAGWVQTNIIVLARDYLGGPFTNHKLLVEFKAPRVATVSEGSDIRGGATTWTNVWLQPEGTVRFLAVSQDRPSIVPEGGSLYKISGRAPLKFELAQRSREVEISASSSEEAIDKVGAKGTAGIDYKIFKAEGEISAERERGSTTGRQISWKVILPAAVFDVKQVL